MFPKFTRALSILDRQMAFFQGSDPAVEMGGQITARLTGIEYYVPGIHP